MAKPLRPKRGTTAKNDAFTGLASEITIDTDKHTIRVHDGVTPGGHETLMTSGGTMKGAIHFGETNAFLNRTNNNGRLVFNSGTDYYGGGSIYLYGKDYSQFAGGFNIYAVSDAGSKALTGLPEGSLTWGDNEVITSAGGTMTGTIISKAYPQIRGGTDNTGRIAFAAGKDNGANSGAKLLLHGADYSESGWFLLQSGNSSGYKQLIGKPDGTLTWGGSNVITSAGGSYKTAIIARQSSSTSYTTICGGTGTSDGARMVLCSKGDTEPGHFKLYANNGTNSVSLVGKPDGTLAWSGKPIIRLVESWTSGNSGYRVYSDGFVEQWTVLAVGHDSTATWTLPKAMKNTSYNVTIGKNDTGDGGTRLRITKTTTSVKIQHYNWEAEYNIKVCGY